MLMLQIPQSVVSIRMISRYGSIQNLVAPSRRSQQSEIALYISFTTASFEVPVVGSSRSCISKESYLSRGEKRRGDVMVYDGEIR